MIEATLIDFLKGKTAAGANVFAEVPKNPPSTYIVIEKTGSATVMDTFRNIPEYQG